MSELKEKKNKSCGTIWVDTKKKFNPNPQSSLFLPPKSKKTTFKLDKIKSKNSERHWKHMLFCYMRRPKTNFET